MVDWKNMPPVAALRAFDAVARFSSFSAAGRSLNVTHAAVAQQVRALEAEIGVPLVRRAGRGVALTPIGERLAQAVQAGFQSIADGVETARQAEREQGLRVATTMHIVDTVILPRLAEFWLRAPGVEVALRPGATYVDILSEGYDLAVRAGSGNWPELDVVHLADAPILAVGAPDLVAGVDREGLQDLPWIVSREVRWEEDLVRKSGLDFDRLRIVDPGNPQFELSAARQGLGMILATETIVRGDLEAGRLARAPFPEFETIGYFAVTPPGPKRRAVSEFIDWLRDIFAA